MADLGLVVLVFLIATRLFDKRVGLLAGTISAVAVMQIQESHFWTVDNFANFFTFLAVLFAVRIATYGRDKGETRPFNPWELVGFGLAFGLSLASKINQPAVVAMQALMLPAALGIRVYMLPRKEREANLAPAFWWLVLAGALSFVMFRLFQPYAFQGLGLTGWFQNIGVVWQQSAGQAMATRLKDLVTAGFGLNPHWIDNMLSLAAQVNGDADWPPSMQWARRSFWFGLHNIVGWGLGWPLALLCLAGMAWAGWRIVRGDWRKPLILVWTWGVLFFLWQSMAFNPTMRYFLPIYPVLAVFGAWAVVTAWDLGTQAGRRWQAWLKLIAAVLGGAAILAGALWAYAFVQIYQQDVSRIAATRWIYQNVPGPITVNYQSSDGGQENQPLPFSYNSTISPETPFFASFSTKTDGSITQLSFKYVLAPVQLDIRNGTQSENLLIRLNQVVDLEGLAPGEIASAAFDIPGDLLADPSATYQLVLQFPAGEGQVLVDGVELSSSQSPDIPPEALMPGPQAFNMGASLQISFANTLGALPDTLTMTLSGLGPLSLTPVQAHIALSNPDGGQILDEQDITLAVGTDKGGIGTEQAVNLATPLSSTADKPINLQISVASGSASLLGSAVANESSWDDGLPLRMQGYDGFGGIYQGDLNFEMYWDADASKVDRFLNNLDHSEFLFITSSRQWGSLPRIPERFPLVVAYYRALIGCPEGEDIEICFIKAQVDNTQSLYGFKLVQVFENSPRIGPWKINDQASEEAFTVYDHPKVFIFQKTTDYDPQKWADLFAQVDLTQVQHLTPKQATGSGNLPNLMLPADRLTQQQAGGTWSDIFNTDGWINASPWISAVSWYLALFALGLAVYPLVRWTLAGLSDGGYPFARLVGLLLLSYLAWVGGSLGLTFSRGWLVVFAVLLSVVGAAVGWLHRKQLRAEWEERKQHFLRIEFLFLLFFILMLAIRFANPDLWHPSFGGEKPMDFAYFNAVLKSTSFPPFDPWFAGGYINYYYYGFVLVGSLVKLLGIVPSVAYNLILPSLFAMLALGAYSLAWNLWGAWTRGEGRGSKVSPELVGLAAAVAVLLLGNLASLGTLVTAFARLGSEGAFTTDAGLLTQLRWMVHGLVLALGGQSFPVGRGEWYWDPTRIIPAPGETGPISEFPLFTFTYADLHAHMIALPVTLLGLGWSASAVLGRAWNGLKNKWQVAASLVLGGIILGSLRPINTWDLPTYLLIAALAVGYSILRYAPRRKDGRSPWLAALGGMTALGVLSVMAYQPFVAWYRQGYSSIELWSGTHTPAPSYLNHWGIFLFFIIAWLVWETRIWLASTPLSSLRKLEQHYSLIVFGVAIFLFAFGALFILGVRIVWLALPLLVWVGLLFFRPGLNVVKRLVVFLVGTGLFLTLMVEVIRLQGDISRMNTVFKFYMQAWVLLAVSAALAFAWTLDALRNWAPSWRAVWQTGAVVLLACGAMFMLEGVPAKMGDRMAPEAPHTLNGAAYMQYATYYDQDQAIPLIDDYLAIRWMQENVQGSPAIVEAHTGEYKWGGRFSIYTGLPAVLGWNWHQRQQREFVPGNDIWGRVGEIQDFYTTTDLQVVQAFLDKYKVHYIIVGQLERAYYPGDGLNKFEEQDGRLWQEVFRSGETVIYKVLPASA